jgi:cytochrome c553
MKSLPPFAALATLVLAMGATSALYGQNAPAPAATPAPAAEAAKPPAPPAVSASAINAKINYCKGCHGTQGQGYLGHAPIPRLAGQQQEYFEGQLKAYIDRRRQNPIMFNVAHVLSPDMVQALANHFYNLTPKPYGTPTPGLVAQGKDIFEHGVASAQVPACSDCHGADAHGQGGVFPRLAGQLPQYIIRKLTDWDKERGQDVAHPDNSAMMQPVTHGLKPDQVKAVASYLSTLQ